jgi:hypothetical protein
MGGVFGREGVVVVMRLLRLTRGDLAAGFFRGMLAGASALALASGAYAQGAFPLVVPGMTQTELQSVMGPPDYIQVKRLRQAWQYCPHFFDRLFRRGELFYVTVWFNNGQVDHLRAYPYGVMGTCEDFLAAFRWEDILIDSGAGAGFAK